MAMVRLSETPGTWGKAWHVPNPLPRQRGSSAGLAASIAAQRRGSPIGRWQLRLVGTVVPAVREIIELLYEFEDDWVVDHGRYAALLGDHATPIDDALRATVRSHNHADRT